MGSPTWTFVIRPTRPSSASGIRSWLAERGDSVKRSHSDDGYWTMLGDWHQQLYEAGFFALTWPAKYGGRELPPVYEVIVDEELARAGAPPKPSLGYLIQGISHHGSEAIKDRFLPGLINGRDRWCQGFSEPDAGSDLASLRTTATLDGDEYVIDGHKIWTSYSDVAEWCIVLARTDPDVPKHKGLSAFAVPMHQPGIEQRPLKMINGITTEFGQVAFDGARVPAANMIGEPGEGWRLAMTIVSHEREPAELGLRVPLPQGGAGPGGDRPAGSRRRCRPSTPISSRGRTSRPRCCGSTRRGACRSDSTA